MREIKNTSKILKFTVYPVIFLILIGLIDKNFYGLIKGLTYHQKVFKTMMIFIFNFMLLLIFSANIKKRKFVKQNKYLFYFLLYFIYILIQYIVSFLSKEISFDRNYYLANYTSLIIFSMFFYLYYNEIDDIKSASFLLSIFFLIVILWSSLDFFIIKKMQLSNFRPKLSFGNTNYFAGYAIGVYPLALIAPYLFYNKNKKFFKNYLSLTTGIIAILGFIPIYFTQTRAAQVGIYLAIFLLFIPAIITLLKINRIAKVFIILIILFIFIFAPLIILSDPPPILTKYFGRIINTVANPVYEVKDRLNGWTGGLALFKKHPVFGAGLGTVYPASFKYIGKYYNMYSASNAFKHSHSEYVEILGEGGIFGILFFSLLAGIILINLLVRVFSSRYKLDYRIISLSIATGIISMLLHQIFSLTLRMSVTMTAYFFLLGTGIFILSQSNNALTVGIDDIEKSLPFLSNKVLNIKQLKILSLVIFVILIISFIIFLPIYRSEYNIRRAGESADLAEVNHYLNKAIKIRKNNVYAWLEKYKIDVDYNINSEQLLFSDKNPYDEIKKDIDTIQSIIPGYKNIWDNYAEYYFLKYKYHLRKWEDNRNFEDRELAEKYLNEVLKYLDKSLDTNFLNPIQHAQRINIIINQNNLKQLDEAIKDFIDAKIHIDFAIKRKIIKERIEIEFNDKSELKIIKDKKENKTYIFSISKDEIRKIRNACLERYNSNNSDSILNILNDETEKLLKALVRDE